MVIRGAAVAAVVAFATVFSLRVPLKTAMAFAYVQPKYEDVKIGDAVARIYFPKSFKDQDTGRRANLYLHGNGQTHEVFLGSVALQQIADGEELVAVIDGQDTIAPPFKNAASGWGNAIYQQRYIELYTYLRKRFKIAEDVDLIGVSMGGLAMGHFIVAKPFPVARAYGLGLVPSLQTIFDRGGSKRQLPIRNAFGMNPDGADDARLHQIAHDAFWMDDLPVRTGSLPPLKVVAGSDDDVFKIEFGGTQAYAALCNTYEHSGGACSYEIVDGVDHAYYAMLPGILEDALKPASSISRPPHEQDDDSHQLQAPKTCRSQCDDLRYSISSM